MATKDTGEKAHFVTSPKLSAAGFRHAFFTRRGGVSAGPYESLNFSVSVGDSEENVRRNLARAARALVVEPPRVYYLSQVHGSEVVVIDGTESPERVLLTEGDAVVSAALGVACAVRIADCVPVLIADEASGAVAAIHAGWRGIVRGVLAAAVARLRETAGGGLGLVAAIGPHISVEAFEVSEDVATELRASSPDPDVVARGFGEKPHVDLARIVAAQLAALGVDAARIDRVPGCTVRDSRNFFSFRRDGKHSGRHLAAIAVRDAR